ncbi:MAG: helix-turn-helix transcriptional regulator [Clostridia bacterium]|nr:helix-turn-helix transcriptional regulator [Clostridia bacterium]
MEDIKTIFASNLAALRTGRQMTQAELAEQLNYSDKAVSKWERGESIPDAAVLKEIGTLFGVSMDELLTDPETLALERAAAYRREPTEEEKQQARAKHRLIQGIVQSGIWLAAALVVVILRLTLHTVFWQIFVFTFPVSALMAIIFTSVWGDHKSVQNAVHVTLFVLGLLSVVYVIFRAHNPWQLYLLMVPALFVIFFSFRLYSFRERKTADPAYRAQREQEKAAKRAEKEARKAKERAAKRAKKEGTP